MPQFCFLHSLISDLGLFLLVPIMSGYWRRRTGLLDMSEVMRHLTHRITYQLQRAKDYQRLEHSINSS
jgi:hypothetical protein